jgi:Flp pilus assembly protein TadD
MQTKDKTSPEEAMATSAIEPPLPAWLTCALLALATIILFWPAMRCDFLNLDDPEYVAANMWAQKGLNAENIVRAFTTPVVANWHPLTMISHMADCEFFGLQPWGHHLVSVLLHGLNTALVFLLLHETTRAYWRSVFVALLFATHPLHVESVAWVAERKDVLSACFGLISLICYCRYARGQAQPGWRQYFPDYALSFFFFACGCLSKPMLVTWPFVLCLLDYWPLGRLAKGWKLVWEKMPFLLLTAVFCVVTFIVQKHGGALDAGERFSLGRRVTNAIVSYCRYLEKLFWPFDLSVYYAHPTEWPFWVVSACGLILVALTVLVLMCWRRHPYLLMGWMWFVGTLVPVIQLVQTGSHAMADRYTYIPYIGLFIALTWGLVAVSRGWRPEILRGVGLMVVIACAVQTRHQLGYWVDSETLFRHALSVTENNWLCQNNLASALDRQGRVDEAIAHFRESLRLDPNKALTRNNYGATLVKTGQIEEAIQEYEKAIRLSPGYAGAYNNLGSALAQQGRLDDAVARYQEALELDPGYVAAHNNLGNAYGRRGQLDQAITHFQAAIRLQPDIPEIHNNLGIALMMKGRLNEAIAAFKEAVQIKPDYDQARAHLQNALQMKKTRAN